MCIRLALLGVPAHAGCPWEASLLMPVASMSQGRSGWVSLLKLAAHRKQPSDKKSGIDQDNIILIVCACNEQQKADFLF